jgi:mono/diheme cytochrome c family protein
LLLWLTSGACADGITAEDCPPIAFVKRQHFDKPFGIGTIIAWDIYKPGGGIYVCDPKKPQVGAREVFRRDDGVIFDMSASFDAKKLLFAWRKCSSKTNRKPVPQELEDCFHIYEIGVDGRGLRQITNGPYQDIHPFYLPDGKIGFVSTRVKAYTMCQPGAACALHIMEPDGTNIRRIHFGTLADHSPFVLDNGLILFTRWEYQDKDLTYLQGLWTIGPGGRRVQLFFGNTIFEPAVIWQAKPIPNTSNVLCTLAPHHGNPVGAVGIIDRSMGLENPLGITNLTPEIDYDPKRNVRGPGDKRYRWAYRDPYPIGEKLFVVSYGGGGADRYRLFLINNKGRKEPLYEDPSISCFNPIPLVERAKPHSVYSGPTTDQEYGTFFLADVYHGLVGVERGTVKAIRVMKVIPKPCNMRGQRAYDMDPLMSRGTYYAKYCLGTVPVDENGSAYFRAPAGAELYFQALDAHGKELCRMGSVTQVVAGEIQSCIGCHESRFMTPPNRAVSRKTGGREPVDITAPPWGPGPMDFVRHVQPVFDRYCVACHSRADPKAGLDLSGDKTRFFNMAYDHLTERRLVNYYWLLNQALVRSFRPLESGSRVSKLVDMIEAGHGDVDMDDDSRRRIYAWIEGNVPYYGTYEHTRPGKAGSRDAVVATKWFERFEQVYRRRCAHCHGKDFYKRNNGLHHTWINLTHPQWSRVLAAPLVKSAGGLEWCQAKDGNEPNMFADKTDADFKSMLAAIDQGKEQLYARPRVDMPGAKPLPYPKDYAGPFTGFAGP